MRYLMLAIMLTAAVAGPAQPTAAQNIDLSTVPGRDTVQLTIYNAEDLTLVRETRHLTFKPGANVLQFSWANTLIDPTSVEIRFLDRPDELTVLDTRFPHDRPEVLYWNVQSEFAGEARVEITYFTSGITWQADYTAIASEDDAAAHLEGYVTVTNNSGEDYENAQIRLVVGEINLVEQIDELARRGVIRKEDRDTPDVRRRVVTDMVGRAEAMMESAPAPRQIVKEGLSEYFIFTIEGRETVPHQWSKRLRSFDATDVSLRTVYRYRPQEYGDKLVRLYLFRNDADAGLGNAPLPDGTVRLFRRKAESSLSYLTQQDIRYIPIGDEIELVLGEDPEVVFELVKQRVFRSNIWLQVHGLDVLRRADEPGLEIDPRSHVVGWDTHALYEQRIRNYTDRPIEVEVRRSFPGDVVFRSELNASRHDVRTVQYTTTVEPGETASLPYEVVTKEGRNAEQQRVAIEEIEPAQAP
ncbi:DUF4139 domain-containing protein [Phycisphaerales bacterium AB-hyl4]|uniref:DUF4139 domain-containing protein n=1 Tax=Natronomicrosphaera hydrolytica TaxID=3242702 RepID=A0ABV4U2I8_9BACT